MTTTLPIIAIGNSFGVILPKEILAALHVQKGDRLHVTELPGGVALRPYDATFASQMEVAESVMREYRDVLKKLAE